ncbi:MAG: helix-turn-helix transcriptional regulator [Arachnia sp.]
MKQASNGPRPLTTPPTISAARRRVLQAVLDLEDAQVTINQVAKHLGGHPNSARQHLDALTTLTLLTAADVQSDRPGRRPRGYTLTSLGRQTLGADRVGESRELADVFASYLVATGSGPEQAQEIGRAWGTKRADELDEEQTEGALEAVVEVLDILGFDPSTMHTEQGDAVILRTCPLLDMAHGSPEFVCNIHRGLIDGVLRRIGAREGVDLLPFSEPNGCRMYLTAPPEDQKKRAS